MSMFEHRAVLMDCESYVMGWGPFKGFTAAEIADNDPDYARWLCTCSDRIVSSVFRELLAEDLPDNTRPEEAA